MEEKFNKQEKAKKVFLDDLPRRGKLINWKESINITVHFISGNIEGDLYIINYDGKYLYIKYLNHDIFRISTSDFTRCNLGKLLKTYTKDYKYKIGQTFKDDKRDITITDRKIIQEKRIDKKGYKIIVNLKYYKYECNKCGFDCGKHYKNSEYKEELWISESNLTKGQGCPVCGMISKVVVEGINDIATTNPELIPYFKSIEDIYKYSYGSNKDKILFICPDCGFEKEITVSDLYWWGFSCKKCGDGIKYPNKFANELLKQINIDFKPEYSPNWIKPKAYDFYIPSMNLIIEMDGALGHGKRDNKMSGQTKEESQAIDDYKDEQARLHEINVIRIDCDYDYVFNRFEYIKQNIFSSKLSSIFDLNNIDWNDCNEFAISNRVKEACKYKKTNPNLTAKDIGEIMKISTKTVIIYLKQGSILDWCHYDAEEESMKSGIIQGKNNGKPVEIFKDGVSLEVFLSISELERKSKELFGTRLCINSISKVCQNIQKEYKGFTFKYI